MKNWPLWDLLYILYVRIVNMSLSLAPRCVNPENNGETFEPAMDKAYRHPTFYILPEELKHM